MRECETFIPSLDIVAVDTDADDKIVGSSMCVKSHIKGDDGCKYDIVTLGPIGVLPEYQNRGIGALDGLQVCQLENETISGMSGIYGIKMQKRFEQLAGKVRPAVLK